MPGTPTATKRPTTIQKSGTQICAPASEAPKGTSVGALKIARSRHHARPSPAYKEASDQSANRLRAHQRPDLLCSAMQRLVDVDRVEDAENTLAQRHDRKEGQQHSERALTSDDAQPGDPFAPYMRDARLFLFDWRLR